MIESYSNDEKKPKFEIIGDAFVLHFIVGYTEIL